VTCLVAALDLYDHGYNPIPTIRGLKSTPVKWGKYQSQRVTLDEIHEWFDEGDYNVAVVCGFISNCVVVDADSPEAIKYLSLTLPPTPMVVHTSKGQHWYYRHPGTHIQSKARVLDNPPVDIRADGGLAQGLGSIHKSGDIYKLGEGKDLLSPFDLPLYEEVWFPMSSIPKINLSRVPISGDSMVRAAKYVDKVEPAGKGLRNTTAFRVAAILTHDFGLALSQAESLLVGWNQKCDPPLAEDELKIIIQSAVTTGRFPIGGKL